MLCKVCGCCLGAEPGAGLAGAQYHGPHHRVEVVSDGVFAWLLLVRRWSAHARLQVIHLALLGFYGFQRLYDALQYTCGLDRLSGLLPVLSCAWSPFQLAAGERLDLLRDAVALSVICLRLRRAGEALRHRRGARVTVESLRLRRLLKHLYFGEACRPRRHVHLGVLSLIGAALGVEVYVLDRSIGIAEERRIPPWLVHLAVLLALRSSVVKLVPGNGG